MVTTMIPDAEPDEMLTVTDPGLDPAVDPSMAPVDAPVVEDLDQVEVAGLGSALKQGAEFIKDKVKSVNEAIDNVEPIGRRNIDEPVERHGDFFVIREPSEDEIRTFNDIIPQSSGAPSPTRAQADAGVPVFQINLENANVPVDDKELMSQIVGTYKDYIEQQKRGSITFKEMIKSANERNMDGVMDLILNRQIGQPLPAEDLIAGRLALWSLNAETTRLNKLVLNGTATDAERKAFLHGMSLEGKMAANLLGGQAEAARATAAGRIGIDVDPTRVDAMQRALAGADENSIDWLAYSYAVLPTQEAQAQFSRGIIGKAVDVWQEVWINSMLSAITTHAVNVGSNTAFALLQIPERGLAGGLGSIRRALTGSKDGVRFAESLAMVNGLYQGGKDGILLAAKAFKTESPISGSLRNKLEVRERKAISAEKFGLDPMSVFGRAMDYMGVAVRLPGRFLLAEDEFFKAVSSRMQLNALATRNMRENVANGMSPGQAQRQYEMTMRNPDESVLEQVQDFADVITFQDDLEGFMGNLQTSMSHPIAKIFVPFFKTPTNVVKQVAQRTPLVMASPKFYKAIKAGGAEADAALAKLALGSTIMTGFAMAASAEDGADVIMTGSGPTAPGARAAFKRQEFQPYSIHIKQDDGTYKAISYSRFDPISGLLAVAADYAQYAKYSDDPGELEQLTMGASLAAANYLGQLPMLQGMANISELFGGKFDTPADRIKGALDLMAKQAANTVLGPLAGGSMVGSIERMMDPTIRDASVPSDLDPVIKGFYQALNAAKARNPLFSSSLPPRLNLWGEEMQAGYGEAWEMASPIRIKDAEYDAVDSEIVDLNFALGNSLRMPSRKIDGAALDATQYNQLLTFMNSETIRGVGMKEALLDEITDPDYRSMGVDDRIKTLRDVIGDYQEAAEKIVIQMHPDLAVEIDINKLPYEERKMKKAQDSGGGLMDKIKGMVD